jgi:hypothetical protein
VAILEGAFMNSRKLLIGPLVVLLLLLGASLQSAPARAAFPLNISGHITDSATHLALKDVCVTLGPPIRCWGGFGTNPGLHTDSAGYYFIDLDAISASPGGTWELYFVCDAQCRATNPPSSYDTAYSGKFVVNNPTTKDMQLVKSAGPAGACTGTGSLTQTTYLPNITRTLGGPLGWDTPFYVQNAGTGATDVEASFYYFDTGALATCHRTPALAAGASVLEDPNAATDLTDDKQYSVVVRSYGSPVYAAVNQTQTVNGKIQGLSYDGFATGATKVYVPNVTRRFFGYDIPLIIQNLGTSTAFVTANFKSFDNTQNVNIPLTIGVGLSGVIDPDFTTGLVDGTQYAVTVTSSSPVAVVANAHNEAIGPLAYSHNGLAAGATTVYGPWATKSTATFSNVVVQNLGTAAATATLTFKPTSGGTAQVFTTASIPAGSASAFDVRFTNGVALPNTAGCGSVASATCLGDGDYGLTVTSTQPVAAVVLPNSNTLAGAYVALTAPTAKTLIPIAQKSFNGWTTSIWLQSISASTATLTFNPIGVGVSVPVTMSLVAGQTKKIDLATLAGLNIGGQYSVVITGDGQLAAAVQEFNPAPGDGLMVFEGFAQ